MNKKTNFKRLMDYAGKHRYLTYLSCILSAISALLALVPFIYIWLIIKAVLAGETNNLQIFTHYGRLAVIYALLSMVVYISSLLCSHLSAFRVQANIRTSLIHYILTLPNGFMDNMGSGKMRKIINESSAATETFLAHQLPDKAGALTTPVGLLFMLLFFDWRLGLLSLIPIAAAFMIMSAMTGQRMKEKMKQYQNSLDQMSNEAVEYVRGIPVVKTFGQSVYSFKRFKATIDNYQKWVIAYTLDLRMPMLLYTTIINAVFAVLIAAALIITHHGVTNDFLLNLIFYIIITPIITVTLNKIMYSSENEMIVGTALENIDSILNMKPLSVSKTPELPADYSIDMSNVCFKYENSKENTIDHITLHINPGEHIAFVGPSGGGKTTLASLISRFWDVSEGEIKIGGVNVKNIPKNALMDTASFVFQDSKLLKTSIYQNIKIAKPNASKNDVIKALHDAQCDDIIAKLPNGIDTVIGSKGVYLSGGEMQRLSIARVMLKNPPILILDEATAFADPDNETKIQKAFSKLSVEKTVVMIAHRLSTVTNTDRIYVLKDGRIVESGKHSELLQKGGLYSTMWSEYQKSAQWKVGVNND